MAHFAELDENNIVKKVIVVNDNDCDGGEFPKSEESGINFCKSLLGQDTIWKQTSYNNNFRYNYAGIGFYYDEVNDAFISPKPFDSWVLDNNFKWKAPVEYPNDDALYSWDEETLSWIPY